MSINSLGASDDQDLCCLIRILSEYLGYVKKGCSELNHNCREDEKQLCSALGTNHKRKQSNY